MYYTIKTENSKAQSITSISVRLIDSLSSSPTQARVSISLRCQFVEPHLGCKHSFNHFHLSSFAITSSHSFH
ncbi:hypothetical protein Scep_009368 [Stephania cephalantha]|uniref:Uncharacterized protein n=1 Tax=Stephania cephalantha TaxID=152367 RepID=A0AAP0PD33_9MAGN